MLERLIETFCEVDDFCKAFVPRWEAYLLGSGSAPRGPEPGLSVSEIITILLVLHGAQFKYLKSFYQGVMGKAFSSLNFPKHRAPLNAFLHLLAALTAYQINPIKPTAACLPLLSLPA